MSAIPAVLENEFRTATSRTAAEESRQSPDAKFQDAVDSRRAERAQAASKSEDAHRSRDQVDGRDESDATRDADRTDAAEESDVDSTKGSTAEQRAQPKCAQRSNEPRNNSGESSSESLGNNADAAPRRTLPASQDANQVSSAGRRNESGQAALPIPLLGQIALEAVFAHALPQAQLPGASAAAPSSPQASVPGADSTTHAAPQTADRADQPLAGLKASNAVAIEADALAPILHAARDTESSARVVDPRGALAAFASPATTEVAAAPATVIARLTPAELPSLFDRLAVRIDTPERTALVHLDPAELGPLRISLVVEPGGHVRAEMHAQRPEGYAALEARLPELHASLIERGFASASVNLSLGNADPQSRRSGTQREESKSSSAGRRTLADAEVRAMLPASAGAIDMWA